MTDTWPLAPRDVLRWPGRWGQPARGREVRRRSLGAAEPCACAGLLQAEAPSQRPAGRTGPAKHGVQTRTPLLPAEVPGICSCRPCLCSELGVPTASCLIDMLVGFHNETLDLPNSHRNPQMDSFLLLPISVDVSIIHLVAKAESLRIRELFFSLASPYPIYYSVSPRDVPKQTSIDSVNFATCVPHATPAHGGVLWTPAW